MREKRKRRLAVWLPLLAYAVSIFGISAIWLQEYRQAAFGSVSAFCGIILEEHPEAEMLVFSALKKYQTGGDLPAQEVSDEKLPVQEIPGEKLSAGKISGEQLLEQYGYRSSEFCEGIPWSVPAVSALLFFMPACIFLFSVWDRDRYSRKRVKELTSYLEQVNGGADGTVIQRKEDEFSLLQDELYKTVTTLYQTRDTAVKAKIDFADNLANIAHQLKTPITAACLSLQLMKKSPSEIYAVQIEKQLERLNRLEESLLTLSKIDAGTLQLEEAPVDLYTALTLAAENLDDLLRKEGIFVSVPDHGCVEICGDLEWTMEALMNLMKNCMEHSARGGTVHCDYSSNSLYAEILIWDDGEGFQEDDIPHLFERFYRGKSARGGGAGIGLALARSIVELQNGNITARNLPGGGACFEIRIYEKKPSH